MPDQPRKRGRPPFPPDQRAPRKPSSGPSGAHRRATPEHLAEVDALIARARVALAPHAHAYRDLDAALGLRLGTISRLRHELRDLSRLRAAVERVEADPRPHAC